MNDEKRIGDKRDEACVDENTQAPEDLTEIPIEKLAEVAGGGDGTAVGMGKD